MSTPHFALLRTAVMSEHNTSSNLPEDSTRVLVYGSGLPVDHPLVCALANHATLTHAQGVADVVDALRHDDFTAVITDAGMFLSSGLADSRTLTGEEADVVLNTIGEGVCVVGFDGQMTWRNRRMRGFSSEIIGHTNRVCRQALQIFRTQFAAADQEAKQNTQHSKKFAFQDGDSYFEVICSPVITDQDEVEQVVAVVWDATSGKRLQRKIDAIDASGRELSRIQNDAVATKTPAERLKLLQDKIIRYSKDLMHFDHFSIRLLDKRSNKLEVVIAEGLPPEALEIDLYAQPEGNGISGYVAATGRSYICHDTEKDSRYVLGLMHNKSSMTVPLTLFDEVVGVYNVESERIGGFNEDDRQFAEIFGRYVAIALNILDLLLVERFTTSTSITDNVVHEIDEPLHQIANESQELIEQCAGDDAMRAKLDKILGSVENIRSAIANVKAGPATVIGCDKIDEHQSDPLLEGKRVLIADDEPNIRKSIRDVLGRLGCVCTTANNGYEACSLLDQDPFDLVVSDIKMPYRNGYEIFAAAQRAREGTPVVLMTGFGYDPQHSIVRASQEGLATVLFKPFKVEQFLDEVRKALAVPQASDEEKTE